jgi:hypothetical protein
MVAVAAIARLNALMVAEVAFAESMAVTLAFFGDPDAALFEHAADMGLAALAEIEIAGIAAATAETIQVQALLTIAEAAIAMAAANAVESTIDVAAEGGRVVS